MRNNAPENGAVVLKVTDDSFRGKNLHKTCNEIRVGK